MPDAGDEARRWWVVEREQQPSGDWRVLIQFADGQTIAPLILASDRLDVAITAAAEAHLRGDRRWTRRSERG